MKNGKTLTQLATELQSQLMTKKDFIVDTRSMNANLHAQEIVANRVQLYMEGAGVYPVNLLAHEQIGSRLGIPKSYYDRMLEEAPWLLTENINHWMKTKPQRQMVRTINGRVRAFLSDRYRPLDNYDLAEHVLPTIQTLGCKVESCELTERRMYLKCVNERLTANITKGDTVQAGIVITNSEVGCGSVRVEPMVYRLVCQNGLIAPDLAMRKYHVGKAGEESEGGAAVFFKDETRQADDKAFWMKVRDVVEGALTEAMFEQTVNKMRKATKTDLVEADPIKAVEVVSKKYGFAEEERNGVLKFLIQGGDLSLYGMVNAITRTAQDVESYDRSTEMERIGGELLETV